MAKLGVDAITSREREAMWRGAFRRLDLASCRRSADCQCIGQQKANNRAMILIRAIPSVRFPKTGETAAMEGYHRNCAAGNMIAETGKRENPALPLGEPEERPLRAEWRQAGFAPKICSCPIRTMPTGALVAWPGPDVGRPDNVARRARPQVTGVRKSRLQAKRGVGDPLTLVNQNRLSIQVIATERSRTGAGGAHEGSPVHAGRLFPFPRA